MVAGWPVPRDGRCRFKTILSWSFYTGLLTSPAIVVFPGDPVPLSVYVFDRAPISFLFVKDFVSTLFRGFNFHWALPLISLGKFGRSRVYTTSSSLDSPLKSTGRVPA